MASLSDSRRPPSTILLGDPDDEFGDTDDCLLDSKHSESLSSQPPVLLATAGYDHSIRFWDVITGACTSTLQFNTSQVNCLAITEDKRIIGAGGNPQIHVFDTASVTGPVRVLEGNGNATSIGFHSDDPWLFSTSDDGSLKIWDLRAAKCQRDIDNKSAINAALLHPNQTEILTADQLGSLRIWDLRTNTCSTELIPEEGVPLRSISVPDMGDRIAVANNLGRVYVWATANDLVDFNYVPISKLQAHETYITKCKFSPNGEFLATTSADHTVGLWQFASSNSSSTDTFSKNSVEHLGEEDSDDSSAETECEGIEKLLPRHSLEGHLKWVWDCSFSADSAYLVTASSDNTARLWSNSSGECVCIYTGHTKAVTSVALNDLAV